MMRSIAAPAATIAAALVLAGLVLAGPLLGSAHAAPPPCSVAPTVHTSAATEVTATGATLSGTVNPNGCDTTYDFEYGGTTAYGATTTGATGGAGTSAQTLSATLTGLSPQTTYHVRIVATNAAGPADGNDVSFTTPASCAPGTGTLPTVVTSAATGVTATDATLHGTVDPQSCATNAYFVYGQTTAYGAKTATVSAGSGTAAKSISAAISGLAPHTTYHARLIATSAVGTTEGPDVTFTTPVSCAPGTGSRPAVVTRPATSVTVSGAKLTGTVNPDGCATTYRFEYGGTSAYGASTGSHSAGAGTTAVSAAVAISKLNPSTTYHFRLVATSAVGSVNGADVTFTTPADCKAGSPRPPPSRPSRRPPSATAVRRSTPRSIRAGARRPTTSTMA